MIESTLSGQQCQALFIPLFLSLAGQKSAYCQNNPVDHCRGPSLRPRAVAGRQITPRPVRLFWVVKTEITATRLRGGSCFNALSISKPRERQNAARKKGMQPRCNASATSLPSPHNSKVTGRLCSPERFG